MKVVDENIDIPDMIEVEEGLYVPAYKTTIEEDIKEMEDDLEDFFVEATSNIDLDLGTWKSDPKKAIKKEANDALVAIEDAAEDVVDTVAGPFTSELERLDFVGDDMKKTVHDLTHPTFKKKRPPPRGSSGIVTTKSSKDTLGRRKKVTAKRPAVIEEDSDEDLRRKRFLKVRKGKKKDRTGSKKIKKY